ncbi:MAG: pilus assembly protein N-terminal domain-containing protein [Rhizomicrobium sp.]
MRRAVIALPILFAVSPVHAAGLTVALDEVRTITFPKPVATVFVGNPAIADINMIDSRHAFLLGKGFGETNVVALDHNGAQVADTQISVTAGGASTVTLERGATRVTYSCTASRCEATPEPGDAKEAFEASASQSSTHEAAAKAAANGQSGQ